MAPFMAGSVAAILTTLRESCATQRVVTPGSPAAELSSTFHALNVPAGTVTSSAPTTRTCFTSTFCFWMSKLR